MLFLYPWAVANYNIDAAAVRTAQAPAVAVASAPPVLVASIPGIRPEFRGLVFVEILVFILVLAAAFAYAWRKGVFTWR